MKCEAREFVTTSSHFGLVKIAQRKGDFPSRPRCCTVHVCANLHRSLVSGENGRKSWVHLDFIEKGDVFYSVNAIIEKGDVFYSVNAML